VAHIDYHVVLDAFRQHQAQCPLCAFLASGQEAYFESMLYSWVGTEGFQNRFLAADGFCPAHTHRLSAQNDGVAVAMLYLPLLKHRRRWLAHSCAGIVRRLLHWLSGFRNRSSAVRGERARDDSCPLCDQIALWEEQFLRNVVRHGTQPELEEAFTAGSGLCLPHYRLLVERIGRVPPWLLDQMEKRITSLEERVDAYTRGAVGGAGGRGSTVWRELLEFMEGPPGAIRRNGRRGRFLG
jgi:hypothetical protein